MIIAVRTPPAAPAAPDAVGSAAAASRRDRLRRLVAWTTTVFALAASIIGAALILWTVIR